MSEEKLDAEERAYLRGLARGRAENNAVAQENFKDRELLHEVKQVIDVLTTCAPGDLDEIVDCDHSCQALEQPRTILQLLLAWDHWRHHEYLHGCSHAR